MAKVKVNVKIDAVSEIRKELNSPGAQKKIGEFVLGEMKDFIARGVSPVRGEGKFEAYSGVKEVRDSKKKQGQLRKIAKSLVSERAQKKIKRRISAHKGVQTRALNNKYPYNVQDDYPDKKASPVNLKLSGKMLKALRFLPIPNGIRINFLDKDMEARAIKHNEGDPKKSLPQRKFLPTGRNDDFNVSISRGLLDLITDMLDAILKKSK